MKEDRRKKILDIVLTEGTKKVSELAEYFDVSGMTIRKDLTILEKQGLIERSHGGAQVTESDEIPFRVNIKYSEKERIATKAQEFIEPGDTILLDSGSINALLAQKIKDIPKLTVITTNVYIARMFRGTSVNTILIGGAYQSESESLIGPMAKHNLEALQFSKAFLGVSGYTKEHGFSLNDYLRADLSQYIIQKCPNNFILTDSTKFGKIHVANIGTEAIQNNSVTVITDIDILPEYRESLEKRSLKVLAL